MTDMLATLPEFLEELLGQGTFAANELDEFEWVFTLPRVDAESFWERFPITLSLETVRQGFQGCGLGDPVANQVSPETIEIGDFSDNRHTILATIRYPGAGKMYFAFITEQRPPMYHVYFVFLRVLCKIWQGKRPHWEWRMIV